MPLPPCRPRSSKLFSCQGAYPEPLSSYAEDFGPKSLLNTHYVCSGSASGNRRNNPHPAEVCGSERGRGGGGGGGIVACVLFMIVYTIMAGICMHVDRHAVPASHVFECTWFSYIDPSTHAYIIIQCNIQVGLQYYYICQLDCCTTIIIIPFLTIPLAV